MSESLQKITNELFKLNKDRDQSTLTGIKAGVNDLDVPNMVQLNAVITSLAGVFIDAAQDDIAAGAGGAISVANYYTTINSDAGGDAFTLADGTIDRQLKKVLMVVDGGGTGVITPANLTGGTTVTYSDAGGFAIFRWDSTAGSWRVIELGNQIGVVLVPVLA